MSAKNYEKKRILIWGKTYPELSTVHFETVCTAGVTEDGSPIRLYPISYRYLSEEDKFKRYQWITARVARNYSDPRPESYAIDCDSIEVGDTIEPDEYEWDARAMIIFQKQSWQFETVDELLEAQKNNKTSIGVVTPRQIVKIDLYERPDAERVSYEEKLARVRRKVAADASQLRLFDDFFVPELKNVEFMSKRIRVEWLCQRPDCTSHSMQILDWEALELLRKHGEERALQKANQACDLCTHAIRFFLGNTRQHPAAFSIGGIWYPKRAPALLFK